MGADVQGWNCHRRSSRDRGVVSWQSSPSSTGVMRCTTGSGKNEMRFSPDEDEEDVDDKNDSGGDDEPARFKMLLQLFALGFSCTNDGLGRWNCIWAADMPCWLSRVLKSVGLIGLAAPDMGVRATAEKGPFPNQTGGGAAAAATAAPMLSDSLGFAARLAYMEMICMLSCLVAVDVCSVRRCRRRQ